MSGLSVAVGHRGLRVTAATHDHQGGAVFGPVTALEAERILAGLRTSDDPGPSVPDVPWAAIVERRPGLYAATASPMLPSGLCWALSGCHLLVSTDAGGVVRAMAPPASMDEEFIRGFAVSEVSVDRTPYHGVRRVPGGSTLVWESGRPPVVRQWCGAETWPVRPPRREVGVEEYRRAFLEVVADLSGRTSPVVAAVSGGLDSTFLVAALANAGAAPIHGLTSVPLPAAQLGPVGGFDPDESGLVDLLQGHYTDCMTVNRIRNDALTRPLTASRERSAVSWWPVYNPANATWLAAMEEWAVDAGSSMLFTGTHGNAAFSHDHAYARRVRGALRRLRRVRPPARVRNPAHILGVRERAPRPTADRAAYLRWLAATDSGLTASLTPGTDPRVLRVDPFRSRRILDLAASMRPAEWRKGGLSRSFARRAGDGWVPDEIRLRTRRGAQGWDAWYVCRNDRAEFLAAVDRVAATPGLAGWVDVSMLRRTVEGWPWGEVSPPPRMEFTVILRLLALAAFVEDSTARLRHGTSERAHGTASR